ncbi:hypothetical protein PU634_14485 [Oceanimonas pelagia]|uniref:Periplasmic heavy metal sensor n=1 Tax=Oceanimonas pelagia TaxID=3028314 RepID=A0AA50KMI1_9GAMM|nr:hypothetical protein [Oceanimonas pelagia]WMC10273.1 hypothetical protein PU634_14485 [Oceanimonas pelagia]
MKTRHSALLLAATLFTVPALASAAHHGGEERGPMKEECAQGQKGGHHEGGHHGQRHHGGKQMDPARFEQRLTQRMEKLETPELKAQFIVTQQARLSMMEQQTKLHRLMAEARANAIDNAGLKAATLDKIAADDQLRQQQLRLMREALGKLEH